MHPTDEKRNTTTTQYTLIKSKSISMGNNIYYVLLLICFVFGEKKVEFIHLLLEFPFEFSSIDFPMKIAINKLEKALCYSNKQKNNKTSNFLP